MDTLHSSCQRKTWSGKVNLAWRTVHNSLTSALGRHPCHFDSGRRSQALGPLYRPCLPSIHATGQKVLCRFGIVNCMATSVLLKVARFEAKHYFISPRPHAMISRPTSETIVFTVYVKLMDYMRWFGRQSPPQ